LVVLLYLKDLPEGSDHLVAFLVDGIPDSLGPQVCEELFEQLALLRQRLQRRLRDYLSQLVIRMLLLVDHGAEEAQRELMALLAAVAGNRLDPRLQELFRHLRLQLEKVRSRLLILALHLQVRREHELAAASLTCQTKVQIASCRLNHRPLVCFRGSATTTCRFLEVLKLIEVVIRKVFIERPPMLLLSRTTGTASSAALA